MNTESYQRLVRDNKNKFNIMAVNMNLEKNVVCKDESEFAGCMRSDFFAQIGARVVNTKPSILMISTHTLSVKNPDKQYFHYNFLPEELQNEKYGHYSMVFRSNTFSVYIDKMTQVDGVTELFNDSHSVVIRFRVDSEESFTVLSVNCMHKNNRLFELLANIATDHIIVLGSFDVSIDLADNIKKMQMVGQDMKESFAVTRKGLIENNVVDKDLERAKRQIVDEIDIHLLRIGKSMTVKEISPRESLTPEGIVAKSSEVLEKMTDEEIMTLTENILRVCLDRGEIRHYQILQTYDTLNSYKSNEDFAKLMEGFCDSGPLFPPTGKLVLNRHSKTSLSCEQTFALQKVKTTCFDDLENVGWQERILFFSKGEKRSLFCANYERFDTKSMEKSSYAAVIADFLLPEKNSNLSKLARTSKPNAVELADIFVDISEDISKVVSTPSRLAVSVSLLALSVVVNTFGYWAEKVRNLPVSFLDIQTFFSTTLPDFVKSYTPTLSFPEFVTKGAGVAADGLYKAKDTTIEFLRSAKNATNVGSTAYDYAKGAVNTITENASSAYTATTGAVSGAYTWVAGSVPAQWVSTKVGYLMTSVTSGISSVSLLSLTGAALFAAVSAYFLRKVYNSYQKSDKKTIANLVSQIGPESNIIMSDEIRREFLKDFKRLSNMEQMSDQEAGRYYVNNYSHVVGKYRNISKADAQKYLENFFRDL